MKPVLTCCREEPYETAAEPDPNESFESSVSQTMIRMDDQEAREASSFSPTKPIPWGQRVRAAAVSEDSLVNTNANASTLSLPSHAFAHDRSVSSSSTPPVSASTSSSSSGPAVLPAVSKPQIVQPMTSGHARGASYTATQRMSGTLQAKKSLPDLRQSHAKIIEERRVEATDEVRPLGMGINRMTVLKDSLAPERRGLQKMGSIDVLRSKHEALAKMDVRRESQDGPTIDESRNSYFRRVSMLPPSTISKAVSPSLLMFIDAVRGLLFALTQLHGALRQFLNFAVSDKVAGVFSRVLEPAGMYLATLINALDRFDSTSRRSAPSTSAVRGVIDAAKESVAVFGKIVAVVRLQTPAFRDADVRYTRQLLLSIYGGMAEVAMSWKSMVPLLADVRTLLLPESLRAPPMSKASSMSGRTPVSPILERSESRLREQIPFPTHTHSQSQSQTHSRTPSLSHGQSPERVVRRDLTASTTTSPRSRGNRRHAGSFSTQDVERGMMMGSPLGFTRTEWPDPTIHEDLEGVDTGPSPPPFPLAAQPEQPAEGTPSFAGRQHLPLLPSQPRSRHGQSSSAGSSYLSAPGGSRNLSVDVRPPTPASATLFDDDLLDVLETATEVGFSVWLRLAEEIGASSSYDSGQHPGHMRGDSASSSVSVRLGLSLLTDDRRRPPTIPAKEYGDLVHLLSVAEQVTTALRESLMALRANPFAYSHTTLPDDAQAFIRNVVKVTGLIKALSAHHTFSTGMRQGMRRLTQATRECAILIQVSSMRPTHSTPALIPAPTGASTTYAASHTAGSSYGGVGFGASAATSYASGGGHGGHAPSSFGGTSAYSGGYAPSFGTPSYGASSFSTPVPGQGYYAPSYNDYASSNEDLTAPPLPIGSAPGPPSTSPSASASTSSLHSGLKGLQLPAKQALKRQERFQSPSPSPPTERRGVANALVSH